MLILAHRGYAAKYPENTMISFKSAIACGADGIETDVQRTKDGVLVLIHDDSIDNVSTGKGLIRDLTYAELLKFDFGIRKGKEFAGERIPTFDEFLDLVQDTEILLNIEIKYGSFLYKGIEEEVLKKVEERGLLNRVIFSSFNHYSVVMLKEMNPECAAAPLYTDGIYKPYDYAMELHADAIHPFKLLVSREIVEECHRRNMKVNVWTVDDVKEASYLEGIGVDAIITNRPKEMLEYLRS